MQRKTEVAVLMKHLWETGIIKMFDVPVVRDALAQGMREIRMTKAAERAAQSGKGMNRGSLYKRIRELEREVQRCQENESYSGTT